LKHESVQLGYGLRLVGNRECCCLEEPAEPGLSGGPLVVLDHISTPAPANNPQGGTYDGGFSYGRTSRFPSQLPVRPPIGPCLFVLLLQRRRNIGGCQSCVEDVCRCANSQTCARHVLPIPRIEAAKQLGESVWCCIVPIHVGILAQMSKLLLPVHDLVSLHYCTLILPSLPTLWLLHSHHRPSRTSPVTVRLLTASPRPGALDDPRRTLPLRLESQSLWLPTLNVTAFVCPSVYHFVLAFVSLSPPVCVIGSPASSLAVCAPYLTYTARSFLY